MILYRVRNKQTKKCLVTGSRQPYGPQWSTLGQFFKKIDTARDHIINLCHDWSGYCDYGIDGHGNKYYRGYIIVRGAHHSERLPLYEVVINEVSINGERTIDGCDIVNGISEAA